MVMTGTAILLRALEDEGIRLAFGIPGTHNIEFYDALADSSGSPSPGAWLVRFGAARSLGVKMITPLLLQLPPRPSGASQIVCTGPPAAEIVLSFPLAKKAILRLSGDQKGKNAPAVPASALVSPLCRSRTATVTRSNRVPDTNAIFRPSGERLTGPNITGAIGRYAAVPKRWCVNDRDWRRIGLA